LHKSTLINLEIRDSQGYAAAMKSFLTTIVTLAAMGAWWLFATNSGFTTVVDLLGLLAIGFIVPFGVEQLIPR
jgi:hypothetical protein